MPTAPKKPKRGADDDLPDAFTSLATRAEHARVNRGLAAIVRQARARRQRTRLYEGSLPTLYLPEHDIWLAAHALPNRYRNAFGPGDPRERGLVHPSIQLNLARTPGGASPRARFMRDSQGRIWLAHTGTLGGRQAGISRDDFLAFVGGARSVVLDGAVVRLIVLGTYDEPVALLDAIARLVHAAHEFRSALAAGLTPAATPPSRAGRSRP